MGINISNLGPAGQNVPPNSIAPASLDAIAAGYAVPIVLAFAVAGATPQVIIPNDAPFQMTITDVLFECAAGALAGRTVQIENATPTPYTDPIACNVVGVTVAAQLGDSVGGGVAGSIIPAGGGPAPAGTIRVNKSNAAIGGRLIIHAYKS